MEVIRQIGGGGGGAGAAGRHPVVAAAARLRRHCCRRRRRRGRRLECLERLPLGPQHTLHLVRLGETALLVASSPAGCALVEALPCREVETRREALA